ncbi:hypothetical protein BU17DRAFT_56833 [Hysterangium stoloniferum]|nr:hypothetical protein BU17DRAFT_56833 [Hysterangium stoloniferum]
MASDSQNRRRSFKTPPIAEKDTSQHVRREKALEEQKRKRAQRVDSSRNLDSFASLSLGPDDDDHPNEDPEILPEGISRVASLLSPVSESAAATSSLSLPLRSTASNETPPDTSKKGKSRKPNAQFANKIMYAELLEMHDDPALLDGSVHDDTDTTNADCSLPADLDTNWVALAPVPRGKRCLAVCNQPSNYSITSNINTVLKSRLKGRTIMTFPSALPPATILDCILDERWKENGILHVLDIIRWKGQELGDCEANFRFWWRDTRLSELASMPSLRYLSSEASESIPSSSTQIFPYPTLFLSVPYHGDLSLPSLLSTIIPQSNSIRQIIIQLPSHPASRPQATGENDHEGSMDVDQLTMIPAGTTTAEIQPDGLLLYVSQATYESGTSPLSSWVPIESYSKTQESPLAVFER